MDKETENKNMVTKQTFYMAILVSLTLGFMLGAVYTSFKLAGNEQQVGQQADPHEGHDDPQEASAEAGDRIVKLEEFLKGNPDNAEAWAELGNLFYDTDRSGDAINAYEKSLALVPGDPNIMTDMGVMYRKAKQPEKAIEVFDQVIAANPAFETARFNKGVVLMHDMNDLPGGIKAWEALVELNPMATAPNGELVASVIERMKKQL